MTDPHIGGSNAASKILPTVNAPYRDMVSAEQLAARIVDPESADVCDAHSFAFFSEVTPELQRSFIAEMNLKTSDVAIVAEMFSKKTGYDLPACNFR